MKLCRYCNNENCNYYGTNHLSKHCSSIYRIDYMIFSQSRTKGVAKLNELTDGITHIRETRRQNSVTVETDEGNYDWVVPIGTNYRGRKPDVVYIDNDLPSEIKETIRIHNCVFAAEINYF